MTIVFESAAEEQLYDLAEIIDDLNISGAGARWIDRFLDFIEGYAKPNITYSICNDQRLANLSYRCITYNDKWVIAFRMNCVKKQVFWKVFLHNIFDRSRRQRIV